MAETLALDTSPVIGPYFTWFWSFSDDVDAAKKFLEVLVLQRPGVRAILDSAGPDELARAMFESRYYEGFHKKDPEANIRDYARMIGATGALIEAALGGAPGGPGASSAAAGFGLVLFFGTLGLLLMRGSR